MKRIGIILMMAMATALQVYSQEDSGRRVIALNKGIVFENNLTWQQVLQEAKVENKYIFIDCYASWCGPCKWMDEHVYVNERVGDLMSKAFIAVRVQMDTTQHDDVSIKDWYATAHEIGEQYHVGTYPSFLFFSPDGRAVHKAIGAANVQDFVTLAMAARDPYQQYYTLLAQYRQGSQPYDRMPFLANTAKRLNEDSLSVVVAGEYIHYLGELPDKDLWTKDNIDFVGSYDNVIHYGDRIFERYFHDRIKIDSIMGCRSYADRLINLVVYNADVRPGIDAGLKDGSEPNWHLMEKTIKKKYGDAFVDENVLRGRKVYYRAAKKWDKYAKYFVLEMKSAHVENLTPGVSTSMALNNRAFEVFRYSKRKKELEEALSWVDKALSMNVYQAQELDTKANLLYKLGRKGEAIAFEQQSLNLAPGDTGVQESYEKMKNGQPTW